MVVTIATTLFVLLGCDLLSTPSPTINIEIGRLYSTRWFDFTIHSVDAVDEYAGHIAAPNHQLWEVVITQIGTFFSPVPMGTFDWFMDDDSFRAPLWSHIGFEDHDEMMPERFLLYRNQSETHTMLFEVPTDTINLTLNFWEFEMYGDIGAKFVLHLQDFIMD